MFLLCSKGQNLRCSPGQGNPPCCIVALYVGEGSEREQYHLHSSYGVSVTSPTTHKQIGLFWCWFQGGWFCVHSRTPWVSPMNSPVRLGVYLATATPTYFYSQRFWGFLFPHWNPGLCGLSCSPVVPPCLSAHKCGTALSATLPNLSSRHQLAASPLHPGCLSPPLQPVWMNVSSLTPWLSDFHIVWFSGSSGWFFIFKFVVIPVLVVQRGKMYLHTPPLISTSVQWGNLSLILGPWVAARLLFQSYT